MAAINFNVNSSSRFVSAMEQRQYYSRSVHTHTYTRTNSQKKKQKQKMCSGGGDDEKGAQYEARTR
jgi:hypothetical protein